MRHNSLVSRLLRLGFFALFISQIVCSASFGQERGPTPVPPEAKAQVDLRPEIERVKLDQEYEDFQFVEDDAPFIARGSKILDPVKDMAAFREARAYDYVLAHAMHQSSDSLAKYAQRNVPYSNLFKPVRVDYLRELLHFEGRVSLVLSMKATDGLKGFEKIDKLYQVWIYPIGQNDPLCLVVSELPEGVREGEDQNLLVEFNAYFFKLFHYESRQDKSGESGRKQWRKAPLFLGKSFGVKPDEPRGSLYTDHMLLWIVGFLAMVGFVIASLGLWYKISGRYVEKERRLRLEKSSQFLEEF